MKIVDFLKKMFLPQPEYGYVINRRNKKPKKKPKIKKTKEKKYLKITKKSKPSNKPVIKPPSKAKIPKKEVPNKKMPVMVKKPKPVPVKAKKVGLITHYFDKISVGVIKLDRALCVGDKIRIKGNSGEFIQAVLSMQINRKDIQTAGKGDDIGIKLIKKANVGDVVTLE